jgi:hypothetical protein
MEGGRVSYARWGCEGSDVYVFATGDYFVCCDCRLRDETDATCKDEAAMIEHLLAHRRAGHTVPESAIERLKQEQKEQGETQ